MRTMFAFVTIVISLGGPALGQEKQIIAGPGAPSTLPFSPAVRVGDTLYLSGQIGRVRENRPTRTWRHRRAGPADPGERTRRS